jgi:hypothetical protein
VAENVWEILQPLLERMRSESASGRQSQSSATRETEITLARVPGCQPLVPGFRFSQ